MDYTAKILTLMESLNRYHFLLDLVQVEYNEAIEFMASYRNKTGRAYKEAKNTLEATKARYDAIIADMQEKCLELAYFEELERSSRKPYALFSIMPRGTHNDYLTIYKRGEK